MHHFGRVCSPRVELSLWVATLVDLSLLEMVDCVAIELISIKLKRHSDFIDAYRIASQDE